MIPSWLRMRRWKERWRHRNDPALAWLMDAHREHFRDMSSGPEVWDNLWENRRRLVRSLAPGRSFLDLGGLYGIAGEIAFLAEQSGATRVVIFDAGDPTDEFDEKHKKNASSVQFIQGDLHDADDVAALGTFDVVWCAGVIYHSPNPFVQLAHLREITRERLLLGSHVIPEIPGIEQACVLYPGISPEMQETYARIHGGPERFPGMASPFDTTPMLAYGNMWWGMSPSALRSMLDFSGFETTEQYLYTPFWIDLLAQPGGKSPDIYPPPGFSRERGERRGGFTSSEQLPRSASAQQ